MNIHKELSACALLSSRQPDFDILDNFPNPVLIRKPDTTILYTNSAHEKATGFTAKEVIGRKFPYPWWTKDIQLAIQDKPVHDGETKDLEVTYQKKLTDLPSCSSSEALKALEITFHKKLASLSSCSSSEALKALEITFRKKNGELFTTVIFLAAIKYKKNITYDLQSWVVDVATPKSARVMTEAEQALYKLNIPPEQKLGFLRLTPRQFKVLQLLALGYSNDSIAETLKITTKSVENYINIIYQELDIANRPEINSRVKATLFYFSTFNSTLLETS